ncbi:MAG TPA: response regulator [Actinomycetota bacterium]|nr:response regulator [Actinomycetota bacterium]
MPLVLIVDDNEKNRKLAAAVLSSAGFETLEAGTGSEGVAIATERVPDVILMDLRLPDMDGAEAARTLKEDERTARIPVVAMSALPLEGRDEWLGAAGFAGSLEKPIRVGTFSDEVRRFCEDGSA